jgi:hypothetical protein
VAAFGYAYDSLYDRFTVAERGVLASNIMARVQLCMDEYGRGKIYDQQQINATAHEWQWVVRNLTIGAFALYDEYPDMLDMFKWSLDLHLGLYPWFGGQDGGSMENAGYYKGTGFHTSAEAAALFGSATGINFFDNLWYRSNLWYLIYAQGVDDMCSQFGDHRGSMAIDDKVYKTARVFAGRTEEPFFDAYWQELKNRYDGSLEESDWISVVLDDLESFDFGTGLRPLTSLPKAHCFRDIGAVFMRSDLANPANDILFEFRSNPYGSVGHGHADANSFNISAFGDRLVLDSGYYDSYGSSHRKNWTSASIAHNTILVNNTGMHYSSWESYGQITDFEFTSNGVYTAGACAGGYRLADVKRFDRQVLWIEPDTYMIVDDLETEEPQTFQWLLHALNPITVDESEKTLVLTTDNAAARVEFFTPSALSFSQTDQFAVDPEDSYDAEPTPNQWHLTAETVQPSASQRFITVIQVCRPSEINDLPTALIIEDNQSVTLILSDGRMGAVDRNND